MKSNFEDPTITRASFVLSEKQMCSLDAKSGPVGDGGINVITKDQTSSVLDK